MKTKRSLSPTVLRTILLIVYSLIGWGLFYYQEGMSLREAYRSLLPLLVFVLCLPVAAARTQRFLSRLSREYKQQG
ncbi:MAG: hypothetical protein HXL26_00665 [Porphyromonadaceae bacterium]|nr:hypothetical protein [Porphyromonadaceae bacterium]